MRKVGVLLCAAAAIAIVSNGTPAQARPQYNKNFKDTYGKKVGDEKVNCGVCHGEGGKNKKVVSDYAKAFGEALGGKNIKDDAKIVEALNETAKKEYEPGKTYGALLEKGELPPPAK